MLEVIQKARDIRLLALDVDGVLTDGRLWFGNQNEELKAFDIKDGLGIKWLQRSGVAVAIITGRRSELVARRARELGIEHVIQGREDKLVALNTLRAELGVELREVAYIGDDLPDLSAIRAAGLGITVADGHPFVARHAHHVTAQRGGAGAVREVCELILHARGQLDALLEGYL